MGKKSLCLLIASALLAYYIYSPIPENVEQRWKLMLINACFKTLGHMSTVAEKLGLANYMEILMILTNMEHTAPRSDEKVTVTDTKFNGVPVRLYVPKGQPDSLKRAVIFIHGGGWCVGGSAMEPYDLLSRQTSERLNAIVISVEYRLAPKYHFPVQFEDVYTVAKYFLQSSILEQYNVDPSRICISGDSAGGNLAAAVAQQLLDDPDVKVKLKIQALLYPALQTIDMDLPSYQDNEYMPILPKSLMLRFWSEYFTTDISLHKAMETNQLVPAELSHLFKYVNWSNWLPEKFKKGHIYTTPTHGSSKLGEKYPGFLDPRAAPLLVDDIKLRGLPLTYVVTCQHDVLRDDGIMYVSRLREAGVQVTHDHVEDAVHGALIFITSPFTLTTGQRMVNNYLEWLNKNL
ncbi:arylacetamide deacetylase isoform X2 [Hemicordylus capensis]|uniref:arylacetamide deacetylase isoform X2 n=1 Tax=Hemicordylus capensis TaxID=884348 RepID=UPI0023043D43|nr:arylacetamide deacetylase isoform X2 [Hemicordylus capensis]